MSHYAINTSPQMANSHRFLIGPPLFAVLLFCFAFVLMQPHNVTPAGTTTASSHSTLPTISSNQPALSQPTQSNTSAKLSQQQAVTMPSSIPVTAGTVQAPDNSSVLSNVSSLSSSGSSTQLSNTGATAGLQPAKPNNQTANPKQDLTAGVTSILKSLKLTNSK